MIHALLASINLEVDSGAGNETYDYENENNDQQEGDMFHQPQGQNSS